MLRLGLFTVAAAGVVLAQAPVKTEGVYIHAVPAAPTVNWTSFAGATLRFEGEAVANAPYSAEAISESTQTLADGNSIRREHRSRIWRDSAGRVRREESFQAVGPWATAGGERTTIFINDPVAGAHYVLNPKNKTAHRMAIHRLDDHVVLQTPGAQEARRATRIFPRSEGRDQTAGVRAVVGSVEPPESKTESLGMQTIEGVAAEGTRTTTVIPAGQIGNEREIEIVLERWRSPELQVDVKTVRRDPRFGETVYRLTNIQRIEPSADLFTPPADYELTETGAGRTSLPTRR